MLRVSCLLLLLAHSSLCFRHAQVAASATRPVSAYGYAQATPEDVELGYGKALGGSGGFVLQHSRWLGLDARGVIMRAREPIHTYIAETVASLLTRMVSWDSATAVIKASSKAFLPPGGFAYAGVAGLDFRLTRGFFWRVADFSYTHIDAGTGASPKYASTGLVYRFF
jgi:hypothetical protein